MSLSGKISNTMHGLKPILMMASGQIVAAVVNIGYKLCENDGMNPSILVAYRFMFSAAFMVPVALVIEWKKRAKLNKTIIFYGFLCGLLGGSLGQNLFLKGLALTSAMFASATMNIVPAMTFVVAVCLRLEKLSWNTKIGKAKVCGTLLGISGAMLLTFYKGPYFTIWKTNINLLKMTRTNHHTARPDHANSTPNLPLGAALCLMNCVCYSLWLIIQAKAAMTFPCPYLFTAMMATWASVQGVVYALCVEKDWTQWILGWDIRLLTASVAGVLGSGLMFGLMAWCIRMRGPVFVSAFSPLSLVLVAIAGSVFMEERLNLGMLLGSILIVSGLYFVLLGKGMELKKTSQLVPETRENEVEVPLPPSSDGISHNSVGGIKDPDEEEGDEESKG